MRRGLLLVCCLGLLLVACGGAAATPTVDTRPLLTPGALTGDERLYIGESDDALRGITNRLADVQVSLNARTGSAGWQQTMHDQVAAARTAVAIQDALAVPPRLAPVAAHFHAADDHFRAMLTGLETDLGAQALTPSPWAGEAQAATDEVTLAAKLLGEFTSSH